MGTITDTIDFLVLGIIFTLLLSIHLLSTMQRIYLDSNVFSNLKAGKTEHYQQLKSLLELYKQNLSFFFSQAHMRDKKSDKTDMKYADFVFMKTYVKDNYFAYDPIEKRPGYYLATPRMAFVGEQEDEFDLDSVLGFFKSTPSDSELASSYKDFLSTVTLTVEHSQWQELPLEQQVTLSQLISVKDGVTTLPEASRGFLNFIKDMNAHGHVYRDLRKISEEGFDKSTFDSKVEKVGFSEAFKSAFGGKSYVETTKSLMKVIGMPDEVPYYDFYYHCYHNLDSFGFSKDKMSAKNTFNNLNIDSSHSYFARYCDYLVTNDKGLSAKSKILYEMFGVETQVLSSEEFIKILPEIGSSSDESVVNFFEKLTYDLSHSKREKFDFGCEGLSISLFMSHFIYMNFFDELTGIWDEKGERDHLVLSRRSAHRLSEPNFQEMAALIAKCIALFGQDDDALGQFDLNTEVIQKTGPVSIERYWQIESGVRFALRQHELLLDKFSLSIYL